MQEKVLVLASISSIDEPSSCNEAQTCFIGQPTSINKVVLPPLMYMQFPDDPEAIVVNSIIFILSYIVLFGNPLTKYCFS